MNNRFWREWDEGLAFTTNASNFIKAHSVSKILVLLNSCLAMLLSSLNLYRLPYFIFLHLFLMNLYRADNNDDKENKE